MNVAVTMRQICAPAFFSDNSLTTIVNVVGKECPLLFFVHFFEQLRAGGNEVTAVNCVESNLDEFFNQLQMSFLGMNQIYWCKNIVDLDTAHYKKFITFMAHYKGPHRIVCFTHEPLAGAGVFLVNGDELITREVYQELFMLFFPHAVVNTDTAFVQSLFGSLQQTGLTLEQACMLMQYHSVVGGRDKELCSEWLSRLIEPQRSFFTLSQYFFARDQHAFMRLWSEMESLYPPEYWLAFWSEQIWQALSFLWRLQEVDAMTARKSVSRLPFSFLQKDYKLYQPRELIVAHNALYTLDYDLKNGRTALGLDLFFLQFFQGIFARR